MFATARTPGGNRSPSPSRGRGPDFAAASDETSPVVGRTATIGRTGGDACVACGEAIGGKFLRLPEGRYHPDCLQCEACQTTLKGAYAEVEGKRYCRACGDAAANQGFQQAYDDDGDATCAICTSKVGPEFLDTALGMIHADCYRCGHCNKQLSGSSPVAIAIEFWSFRREL